MLPMLRRLFTVLSALSLLLCAATAVLWFRSYWRSDLLRYDRASASHLSGPGEHHPYLLSARGYSVYSWQGELLVGWYRRDSKFKTPEDVELRRASRSAYGDDIDGGLRWTVGPGAEWSIFGFGLGGGSLRGWGSFWAARSQESDPVWNLYHDYQAAVMVPHWFPILLSAVLPAAWATRRYRRAKARRRVRQNLCPICGYDLRATPGRCPECGAVPAEQEA
jgi:hypothetical protein